jgi:CRP-like cAMP-binding protein
LRYDNSVTGSASILGRWCLRDATALPPSSKGALFLSSTPLLRRLEAIGASTQEERDLLANLPGTTRHYEAHQDIVRQGDRPSNVCLLIEGMACRYKFSTDGKRHILSFHIPGDIPDLQSLFIDVMDHSLATLVPFQDNGHST